MPGSEILVLTFVLLVAGVFGSIVPSFPGPILSLLAGLVYWWSTGFVSPGPLAMAVFFALGIVALTADYLSGPIAAKIGGASNWSIAGAVVGGFILLFTTGPLGMVLGIPLIVFVMEFYRGKGIDRSLKAAFYTALGVLGSALVQFVITFSMLVYFALLVFG